MFGTGTIRIAQRLLTVTLFLAIPMAAYGATYYVDKAGSNNNSCTAARTQSTAKQTITAGISCMVGSDTLIVGNGVYAEAITDNLPSGSPGAPTILRAANRNGAILRST